MKTVLALAALLALVAVPAPASAVKEIGNCVNYLYVADYQWYYVCVDGSSTTCPVYTIRSNGASWFDKECVPTELPDLLADGVGGCVNWANDLEYAYWVCVKPFDPDCWVFAGRTSGSEPEQCR